MEIVLKELETGNTVKVWKRQRGHDYVVLGKSTNRGETMIHCIKNNCINNDGSVHASTSRVHISLPVEVDENGIKFAARVTRVEGSRKYDRQKLAEFVKNRLGDQRMKKVYASDAIFPNFGAYDARASTQLE